jgi:3-methyl-2-oxobutanoate hydroxymethyltransferase
MSAHSHSSRDRVTTQSLLRMRQRSEPITMLTAYDFPTARVLDEAGIDCLLVGDSLGMVIQGHETTLRVTLDQIIYHTEMVARACERALVVADLPFPEAQIEIERTVNAAARVLKETRATAVKLEGGAEQTERIEALVAAGVPVMGHIGLRPQNVLVEGGFRVQRDEARIVRDARAVEAAGAFAIVIECVPSDVGAAITSAVQVPTIGIGAGPDVSGQVLVTNDLLGMTSGYLPKFVKSYANWTELCSRAVTQFRQEVQARDYPGPEHCFKA